MSTHATSYHTQHAPVGAFASFTIGLHHSAGGFGQALAGPAKQGVFIGARASAATPWQVLPFFEPVTQSAETAFTGEVIDETKRAPWQPAVLKSDEFARDLGWATDRWSSGSFRFTLASPWARTKDPASLSRNKARQAFAPAIFGWIEYDNTASSETAELIFGLRDPAELWRPLSDANAQLVGFASGSAYGYATRPSPEVEVRQAFNLFEPKYRDYRGLHLLGPEHGLVFRVPPRAKRRYPLVLGFYQAGPATTGIATHYYYTQLFADLEDVLTHGLAQHATYARLAAQRDRELARTKLTADQRWLIAQSTHSYFGSTQLLRRGRRPLWAVNEGEYRMLNTFDLTVDHLFFELDWQPWAVRNTLDLFTGRYAYRDSIHSVDGQRAKGGLSFAHDMGVCNQFTPAGRSSYECADLEGCFSHMTMEQLVNWVCCAVTYAEKTRDKAWLKKQGRILRDCAESLRRRDHPDPAQRDGLLKWDSDRCGPRGSEITTYDSLDVSLGQARNNLYLAVKTVAAWLLLERAFTTLKDKKAAAAARASTDLLVATLESKFESDTGFFPAVFEKGNRSRILPAVEGLVFPLYLGFSRRVKARYPAWHRQLGRHLGQALQSGVCLDPLSGAWKISSTSHNTWFSKIALAQHVARRLFPDAVNPGARAGDAVHVAFQQGAALGRFALVDQFNSSTGADIGSRYYPRGVTACLWMSE